MIASINNYQPNVSGPSAQKCYFIGSSLAKKKPAMQALKDLST
jgi:hypothetical protein